MKFKFYISPETGKFHIYDHGVTEDEIKEALMKVPHYIKRRKDGSFLAFAKLKSGRYLKIVFRKSEKNLYSIITAYDLDDQSIIGLLDQEDF